MKWARGEGCGRFARVVHAVRHGVVDRLAGAERLGGRTQGRLFVNRAYGSG